MDVEASQRRTQRQRLRGRSMKRAPDAVVATFRRALPRIREVVQRAIREDGIPVEQLAVVVIDQGPLLRPEVRFGERALVRETLGPSRAAELLRRPPVAGKFVVVVDVPDDTGGRTAMRREKAIEDLEPRAVR